MVGSCKTLEHVMFPINVSQNAFLYQIFNHVLNNHNEN